MYQKVIIVGNLGQDPEMRFTPAGQAVTNFSVATTRPYTVDGNKIEETVWFRVSTWGKLAEICNQYLSKGKQVFVEGRLTVDKETGGPRTWQAKDGTWRASYEIMAHEIKFLGQRDNGGSQSGDVSEDEIPF